LPPLFERNRIQPYPCGGSKPGRADSARSAGIAAAGVTEEKRCLHAAGRVLLPATMPEDEPLHQPNDKLFKQVFSDPATAAGFLSAYLPEALAAAIDWPALQLEAGSFIDSQFRHHESDLLFRAPVSGSEVFIYCLFEHQTREDPVIALRLLRYMVCIWEVWLKKSPGMPLPVILPVVLAQNDRAWKTLPAFSAMFDLPESLAGEMGPFIPDFLFRLVQLSEIPFDAIRGTPAGIMVLRVMKAERTNELLGDPVWDEPLMVQLPPAIFEIADALRDGNMEMKWICKHFS